MMPVFTEHFGNASSIHWFGQHAKALMDDCPAPGCKTHQRRGLGDRLRERRNRGGQPRYSRNCRVAQKSKGRHIITSKIEHHAVLHTCRDLEKQGYEVTWLPGFR